MEYLVWIVIALIAYSVIGPVVKLVETEVPTETDVTITTAVMLVVTVVTVLAVDPVDVAGISATAYLYAVFGGVFLAAGVITFFKALRAGPVSVVVPIYGLFIVMSSVIGIVFFGEASSPQKLAGIALAIVAIYLTSRSGA